MFMIHSIDTNTGVNVIYIVSPRFYRLIQTGPCPESEKVRTLKIEYSTVLHSTVNSLYCLAHILIGYNMVQYAYTVYMGVKYGYTCNRAQYDINPKPASCLLGGLAVNCCTPSESPLFMLVPPSTHTNTASKATTGTLLPSTNSVTLRTVYRTGSAAYTQGHFSAKIRG